MNAQIARKNPTPFEQFVNDCGGRKQAAEQLGCSYQLVCFILTGERQVSKEVAERVEQVSGGKYDKCQVLCGRP